MGNFTNTYQDLRNLTCRPRDNLTFRKELERQCHMQMLVLLFAAFAFGCLLIISVRAMNKYWCSLRRRRVSRPIPERWSNRSDHYVTSIIGGIVPLRTVQQLLYLFSRKRYRSRPDFCGKLGLKYCRTVKNDTLVTQK